MHRHAQACTGMHRHAQGGHRACARGPTAEPGSWAPASWPKSRQGERARLWDLRPGDEAGGSARTLQPSATDGAMPATKRPAPALKMTVSVTGPGSLPPRSWRRMAAFSTAVPPLRSSSVHLAKPSSAGSIEPIVTPLGVTVAMVATAIGASSSRPPQWTTMKSSAPSS